MRFVDRLLIALTMLLLPAALSAQPAKVLQTGRFLHLSDIHFDPFSNPDPTFIAKLNQKPIEDWPDLLEDHTPATLPGKGQDTNYALLKATLAAVKKSGPYDYVIYSGDYLSHGFVGSMGAVPEADRTKFAAKTVAFVNMMVGKATLGVPLIAALGNNDSACGDYKLTPEGDILADVAPTLPVLRGNAAATADFLAGGYYLVPHPTVPNQDIAVLSVFWSREYDDHCPHTASDPAQAQLAWLTKTLAAEQAAGRKVTLLMHILPGIDGFDSSNHPTREPTVEWTDQPDSIAAFQALVGQYQGILVGGYAGHTHMDEFRAMPGLAIRVGPAVTPRDGNKTAFTVVDYDRKTGAALDYRVTVLGCQSCGYRFSTAYGVKGYSAANLQALAQRIMTGKSALDTFQNHYEAGHRVSGNRAANWRYFGCALSRFDPASYQTCIAGR